MHVARRQHGVGLAHLRGRVGAGRDPLLRRRCADLHLRPLVELQQAPGRRGRRAEAAGRPQPLAGPVRPALLPGDERGGGRQLPRRPNDATRFPAELVVDYVRVYDKVGGYGSPKPMRRAGASPGRRRRARRRRREPRHRPLTDGDEHDPHTQGRATPQAARPGSAPHQPAFAQAGQGAGSGSGSGSSGSGGTVPAARPPAMAPRTGDPGRRVSRHARAGVHGLCFSPYLEGQAPGAQDQRGADPRASRGHPPLYALGAHLLLHRRPRADAAHRARTGPQDPGGRLAGHRRGHQRTRDPGRDRGGKRRATPTSWPWATRCCCART
jgi:hypothetical protein